MLNYNFSKIAITTVNTKKLQRLLLPQDNEYQINYYNYLLIIKLECVNIYFEVLVRKWVCILLCFIKIGSQQTLFCGFDSDVKTYYNIRYLPI